MAGMSPLVRRSFVLMAAVVAAVSCSGGDGGDDADGSDSIPDTSSTATTWAPPVDSTDPASTSDVVEPTTAPADTVPVATDAVDTTAAPSAGDTRGECLVGAWVVTEEQMNAYYAGMMTTVDAPITLVATGHAGLTFGADGTYSWAPAFDLAVDIVGSAGTGSTTGTIHGSWTASDGTLTTASDVNAIELTITVNGTTFSGSDLANGLLNSSPINGVTYSCVGPAPVLDFKTADPAVTVPVTLAPA